MIAKISNPIRQDFRKIIQYHEQKCAEEKADLIEDNLVCSRENFAQELTSISHQNDRIKNLGFDISFNFHYSDEISDEQFLQLKDIYLDKMGWTNPGVAIYRHDDKDHQHYHMVVTSINMDGERNKELDWYYKHKSKNICRELEVQFGLKQLKAQTFDKEKKFIDDNVSSYVIYKSIDLGRVSNDKKTIEFIKKHSAFFDERKSFTNDTIKSNIPKNEVDVIMKHLEKNGYKYQTDKSILLNKLDVIRRESRSRKEYIDRVNSSGLYVRDLQNKEGYRYLHYVYNGKDYHDTKFPFRFKRESFDHVNLVYKDRIEQKNFLYARVVNELKKSKSLTDLIMRLNTYNIRTDINSNSSGIKGLSFSSMNVLNVEKFKATELSRSLSYNKINEIIISNNSEFVPIKKAKKEFVHSIEKPIENKSSDQSDDFMIGKQREKGIDDIKL